jgi:biopolymer transport protein ExbB/TolQ
MLETYGPLVGNGVGVVGCLVWLFWMLSTGRLATGRELREKDKTIAAQAKSLEDRDRQLAKVLDEYLPGANAVMQALHQAGERHEAARDGNANAGEMSER